MVFISLQAAIDPEHKAVAASGLFLTWPIGMTVGLAAISATMLGVLRKTLNARLVDLGLAAAHRETVRTPDSCLFTYANRLDVDSKKSRC